jgi:hypothetical protein
MKQFAVILAVLLLLAVLLAAPLIAVRREPSPDCAGRVVMVHGARGERLECVCIGGTLSTCFNPGP